VSEVVEHVPTNEMVTERSVVLRGDSSDNAVILRGRVSSLPVERELPSGTRIATFRLSVARARTAMTAGSKQGWDWVDCTAWTSRARRTVGGWDVGDEVEVTGALRRRFFPSGLTKGTRLEVEVVTARRARPRDQDESDADA
jgi:single-strand DNA-binding protein